MTTAAVDADGVWFCFGIHQANRDKLPHVGDNVIKIAPVYMLLLLPTNPTAVKHAGKL